MDKAGRLLKLLGLLETRRDWTASELSDRLGVTARTVRRDVDALRELGYPVNAMSGPGGGYQLGNGGSIPPLMLDEDEAVALAAALRMASRDALLGMDEAGLSLMAKIEQMLPPKLRARLDDVMATTVMSSGRAPPRFNPSTLSVLARAARNDERVRFVYHAPGRDPMDRHVEPYRVVVVSRTWYLVAFDRDRDDWRTFRLDRMEKPHATGMRFGRVDPPDPIALVEEGMALRVYDVRATVLLGVPIDEAQQSIPGTVGRLSAEGPDRTRLELGADDPEWIARYLASLFLPFQVLDPPQVREAVADLGRRLAANHV